MSQKLIADLPDNMDLTQSWQIVFAAVDPNTGAAVTGITISNIGMLVDQLTPGGPIALQSGPFQLIPLDELNPAGG